MMYNSTHKLMEKEIIMNNVIVEPRDYFVSTSLQGYLQASYDDLVQVFGNPQCTETSGDGKVDTEWELQINDLEFPGTGLFRVHQRYQEHDRRIRHHLCADGRYGWPSARDRPLLYRT